RAALHSCATAPELLVPRSPTTARPCVSSWRGGSPAKITRSRRRSPDGYPGRADTAGVRRQLQPRTHPTGGLETGGRSADLAHQVLREQAAVRARDELVAVVSHD